MNYGLDQKTQPKSPKSVLPKQLAQACKDLLQGLLFSPDKGDQSPFPARRHPEATALPYDAAVAALMPFAISKRNIFRIGMLIIPSCLYSFCAFLGFLQSNGLKFTQI